MKNILTVFEHATEQDMVHGLGWYPYANLWCNMLAKDVGIPVQQVAGVLSALSPRNKWERNLQDCENLIRAENKDDVRVSTFGANKDKAIRILMGEDPEEVLGTKTWNFYNNILDPSDPDYVTIDQHAIQLYEGQLDSASVSPKKYREASEAYIKAANKLGLSPCQVQAITWVTWRRERKTLIGYVEKI